MYQRPAETRQSSGGADSPASDAHPAESSPAKRVEPTANSGESVGSESAVPACVDRSAMPCDGEHSFLLSRREQQTVGMLALFVLAGLTVVYLLRPNQHHDLSRPNVIAAEAVEFRVDLNQADAAELALLPGIGETLAKRIIASRENDGPFHSPDDLLRVNGIGPKKLASIRPFVADVNAADTNAADTAVVDRKVADATVADSAAKR